MSKGYISLDQESDVLQEDLSSVNIETPKEIEENVPISCRNESSFLSIIGKDTFSQLPQIEPIVNGFKSDDKPRYIPIC
jgi:hypothetical protein